MSGSQILNPDGLGPHPKGGRDARDPEAAPVFVIHSLTQAVAALSAAAEAGRAIVLASAPEAGISAGSGWFREVVQAAREAVPPARFRALLDCGDDAGAAMAAIRAGIEAIVFNGRTDVAARLADVAAQKGGRVVTERPVALLDLGSSFFGDSDSLRRRCRDALASLAGFC